MALARWTGRYADWEPGERRTVQAEPVWFAGDLPPSAGTEMNQYRLVFAERPALITHVDGVTYTDSEADMDSFDLTVNNWDPDGNGPGRGWFKYSDSDVFDPWQDVELSMGYYRNGNDELQSMLVGPAQEAVAQQALG